MKKFWYQMGYTVSLGMAMLSLKYAYHYSGFVAGVCLGLSWIFIELNQKNNDRN